MPHLLLVDDDDLFRESLGLNLVDEGYEVTSFDNGQKALAYLNRRSADVMLLDWRMPELTGIEVLRRMRNASRRAMASILRCFRGSYRRHAGQRFHVNKGEPSGSSESL